MDVTSRKLAEAALIENEAKLGAIVGSAMDAIITIDQRRCVVLFNAAAEKMFGCPANEALGRSLDRFIPERFRDRHIEHIHNFGETGATTRSIGQMGSMDAELTAQSSRWKLPSLNSNCRAKGSTP
jgi:PAS domain-containing protein